MVRLSKVRFYQRSANIAKLRLKSFLIELDRIKFLAFESFQHVVFRPFKFAFPPFPTSSISFWKCNLRWQMCVRRKKGFRLSQLKFVHFRLATEMILSSLSERKRKAHLSSQNPDVEEKMKIKVNACSCLLIGSLYLNPLLFLYISLPSRHIPIRRRP